MDIFNFRTIRKITTWIVVANSVILFLSYYIEASWILKPEVERIVQVDEKNEVKFEGTAQYDANKNQLLSASDSESPEISPTFQDNAQNDDNYVAICMSVRSQSLDLPEFLHHHYHHHNINHFYIQDDGTIPPLSTHKNYWSIPSSALTFTYYPRDATPSPNRAPDQKFQPFAYEECNRNFGHKHTWLAYLDTDEFLEMTKIDNTTGKRETLQEFLRGFEANETIGAVVANWKVHTSSSHIRRQSSVRKSYTSCINDRSKYDNRFVKGFVKTSKFEKCENPHWFYLKNGSVTVGENGRVVGRGLGWRTPVGRRRVAVHHFATKSFEEFGEKVGRGSGMGVERGWGWWEYLHGLTQVRCEEMVGYGDV